VRFGIESVRSLQKQGGGFCAPLFAAWVFALKRRVRSSPKTWGRFFPVLEMLRPRCLTHPPCISTGISAPLLSVCLGGVDIPFPPSGWERNIAVYLCNIERGFFLYLKKSAVNERERVYFFVKRRFNLGHVLLSRPQPRWHSRVINVASPTFLRHRAARGRWPPSYLSCAAHCLSRIMRHYATYGLLNYLCVMPARR